MDHIAEANNTAILASGLVKRFGAFTAVDGIDFEVRRGEIFGFLGPNGSGKTTTIRMMLGLLRPTQGSVEVLGLQVSEKAAQIRPHIGYMSQRFSLYNDLTVLQNLHFYGRAYGLRNALLEERVHSALLMAGLQGRERERTRDLAGGLRQRLALGAAILHRPQIVFLDEPTAGVDPASRRVFWDLLYDLAAQGITIFVTTHYMDEAEHCHRLAFIQRGKLIAQGSPQEIKQQFMHGQVLEIAPSEPSQTVKLLRAAHQAGKLSFEEVALYGSLVHVVASQAGELMKPIEKRLRKAGIEVEHMALIEPSLEDVFIACMR
ncbi:MAG: ABC transporter ATP-binding protein [Chloroflexota bacterium]